jgi:hypothetical protein
LGRADMICRHCPRYVGQLLAFQKEI